MVGQVWMGLNATCRDAFHELRLRSMAHDAELDRQMNLSVYVTSCFNELISYKLSWVCIT